MSSQQPIFWLRTAPHHLSPTPSRFANLYLRHAASGSPSVVLTPAPPKFLRSHLSPIESTDNQKGGNRVIFTTWRPQDEGREWGLLLDGKQEYGKGSERGNRDMWAAVHIKEGDGIGDKGFVFSPSTDIHEGKVVDVQDCNAREVLNHEAEVKGWMVCQWAMGHPQLFWLTDAFEEGKLPEFCERVDIVKVEVVGQVSEDDRAS